MLKQFVNTLTLFFLVFLCAEALLAKNTSSTNVVAEIKIIGNKTTKNRIIIRELPFNIGDTIAVEEIGRILERSKSNLMNTLLFNFVILEIVYFDSFNISIYITVEERWYWWPIPIFEGQETNFNTWWLDKGFNKINYGLFVAKENFRGRKERITVKFQKGFTEQIGANYSNPYINKNRTQGLSFGGTYSRNRKIDYTTKENKFLYYESEEKYIREEFATYTSYEFRPKLYNVHRFRIDYRNVNMSDSIINLNPNYLFKEQNNADFFSLSYFLSRDKRNFRSYPTKGYFYSFQLKKDGLTILDKEINLFFSTIDYRKFIQLTNKFYLAGSLRGKYSFTKAPYYLLSGLGFGTSLVRGYELYVIRGDHYGLFKTQLRYALLRDKIFNVNAIKFEEFNKIPLSVYIGTYFDAGYVDSQSTFEDNFLTNKLLMGGGISLDFVSYYDMVFRVEYSINKLGDSGLFLHFVAPI